ncbi:MAG TPA: flagellar motor switch protein FliG [Acidobacteria bacterium]|nr:flagellar motor switch protein FliG [Acidobacteriota bacterium]
MADELTGAQKAAIVLTLLGEEAGAEVLKHLQDEEVRAITMEIAQIKMIDPSRHEQVLGEFHDLIRGSRGLELAGPHLAKKMLALARPDVADKLLHELEPRRVRDADEDGPIAPPPELPDIVLEAPSRRLAMLLSEEPPQTVALIMALLPPRKAARVMKTMETERRLEVTRRMAAIQEVQPEVVKRIGRVLEESLKAICEEPLVPLDGVQAASDTLQGLGRAVGQEIVDELSEDYPELGKQLRDMLFTFDMIGLLNDRDTQEVLKQVDRSTLALALKAAEPDLQIQFYKNMSERASQMLKEEMEFLGAPKVSEIELAQRQIIELVLKLEKEGAISIEEQAVAG